MTSERMPWDLHKPDRPPGPIRSPPYVVHASGTGGGETSSPALPECGMFSLEGAEWDTSGHDNVCQRFGVENKVVNGEGGIG